MKTIEMIRQELNSGAADQRLSQVYGQSVETLGPVKARILRVTEEFCTVFERTAEEKAIVVTAAGRTELCGNHTDHQRGKVLAASVNLDALACAAPNGTKLVRIYSENYGLTQISLEELAPLKEEENTTASLVYFGKPSGLMDQMACALGGIVTIDFKNAAEPVYRAIPLDFGAQNMALCIVDTGADHADLTADYAAIPVEMRQVAAFFGKEVLSELDPEEFYARIEEVRAVTGDRAVLRAIHYYNDVDRVEKQVAALEEGNFARFLELTNRSGQSSFMYLQNIETYRSAAHQPVAVSLALAEKLLEGKGAFRIHGGGFAGTIQAFVPLELVEKFAAGMDKVLGKGATKVLAIRPVGGAVLL